MCDHGLGIIAERMRTLFSITEEFENSWSQLTANQPHLEAAKRVERFVTNERVAEKLKSEREKSFVRIELLRCVIEFSANTFSNRDLAAFISQNPELYECIDCLALSQAIFSKRKSEIDNGAKQVEYLGDDIFPTSRYTDFKLIGKGAGKKVYKVWDKKLKREVAIAQFKKTIQNRNENREAIITARVDSVRIPSIHDLLETDLNWYIVMDLIRGRTLKSIIDDFRGSSGLCLDERFGRDYSRMFEFRRIVAYILEASNAIKMAHRIKIFHRDLHWNNILVDQGKNETLVIDWGNAHGIGFELPADGITINDQFRPPFDTEGEHWRRDLYCLGAIILYLLHGQTIPSESDRDPAAPVVLEWVALEAMGSLREKNKNRNVQYEYPRALPIEHFVEDLERYLEGQPTLARPEGLKLLGFHYNRFSIKYPTLNRFGWAIACVAVLPIAILIIGIILSLIGHLFY